MADKSYTAGIVKPSFCVPVISGLLCQTSSQVDAKFVIETKNGHTDRSCCCLGNTDKGPVEDSGKQESL